MANPAETPDPNVEVQTPPEQAQNPTEDLAAKLAAAEAEAARLAAERDELSADAQAWRDKQDADKTELQRLAEASDQQKADLAAAQLENARLKAATKFGISEENLDLLTGASAEELDARAEKLADLQKKSQGSGAPPSRTPKEGLTPGGGDAPPVEDNAFPSNWIV